jgi:hypothetical protein
VLSEHRPLLHPPPRPAPLDRHLTPLPHADDGREPLPEDEYATSLDATSRVRPLSSGPEDDDWEES